MIESGQDKTAEQHFYNQLFSERRRFDQFQIGRGNMLLSVFVRE